MLKHRIQQFIIFVLVLSFLSVVNALPSGFVYLKNIDPSIIQDIRYYSANNFTGHPVTGYDAPTCILTAQAGFYRLES